MGQNSMQIYGFSGSVLGANQQLGKEIIVKQGIRVSLANNGEEGYEKAIKGNFDFILMDMQMPLMDGCQATEKIRESNQKIPIIAMTANAMAEDKAKCLAS
ncbi:response regulator, partial [Oleiphilus sp. HI0086]